MWNSNYNDGSRYRVHYMSAREAYNVVRAAQDGHTGNPFQYRDYKVPPYANSVIQAAGAYALESWEPSEVVLRRQITVASAAITIHDHQTTPAVMESDDGITWAPTQDAVILKAGSNLQLVDGTPAEYYKIVDLGPYSIESLPGNPASDHLEQGIPNPFSQRVTFSYRIGSPTPLRIEVYDIRGRQVRSLVNTTSVLGEGITTWDGRDDRGRQMPNGVYMCRMTTRRSVVQQRLVFLH